MRKAYSEFINLKTQATTVTLKQKKINNKRIREPEKITNI